MPLYTHLSIHLAFSFLAGFIVFKIYKNAKISFISTLISGFFVDFDHFIDYFLAFGSKFNLNYFINGYQFLKSDKIYILFHGWEYVIVLLAFLIIIKDKLFKTVFLGLALGLIFHLTSDVVIDGIHPKTYYLIQRIKSGFNVEKLVNSEHYQKHKEEKKLINL